MSSDQVACPRCEARMRVPLRYNPGMQVQCPTCSVRFPLLPDTGSGQSTDWGPRADRPWVPFPRPEEAPAPSPAQPPPRQESDQRKCPEPARFGDQEEDIRQEDQVRRDLPDGARYRLLDNRFVVRFGDWMGIGQAHYGRFAGPAIGYLFLVLIFVVVGSNLFLIGPLALVLALPACEAGLSLVALKELTGRAWVFADFFGGFRFFWRVMLLNFLKGILCLIFFLPGYGMLVFAEITRSSEDLYIVAYGLLVGCIGPAFYLLTRCFFFATQLVLDRNYGPIEAIEGSWHLTTRATSGVIIAHLLLILLLGVGFLGCGIMALFTFPLMSLVWNAGYLLIAGREPPLGDPKRHPPARGGDDREGPPGRSHWGDNVLDRLPADYDRAFRDREGRVPPP